MSDFKVGDRVRLRVPYAELQAGEMGSVSGFGYDSVYPIQVVFDNSTRGGAFGWLCELSEIEAAGLAPEVFPSANPGHLCLSTDRYSPTWVSRP